MLFKKVFSKDFAFLGYYAASSGNLLQTFRYNLSVPSLVFKNPKWALRMGPIGFPETSVRKLHYSLRNNSEECSSQPLRGRSPKSCRIVSNVFKICKK